MDIAAGRLEEVIESGLWPLVEQFVESHDVAGVAIAVIREQSVVARGFGVRDIGSGERVTPETIFHLASVSKPVVAGAVVSLALDGGAGRPVLDLDAPIGDWVPEFTLADGRAAEVTARRLLSHTSGLPDVSDYGWHDPRFGDDALSDLARSLAGWRLVGEPGAEHRYSNAGYDLLGLLLSRVTGQSFESAVRNQVLAPLGMSHSTFLRADVPKELAASPHVGMPLAVPGDAYPYTRRHAPSSTLHSDVVDMCRWVAAHFEPASGDPGVAVEHPGLDAGVRRLMAQPVIAVGNPPWENDAGLGWAVGSYRGFRTLGHSGLDPGFCARIALLPQQRTGVVILANSNTVPASAIARAALDIVLAADPALVATAPGDQGDLGDPGGPGEGVLTMRALRRSVAGPLAESLVAAGHEAAAAAYRRIIESDTGEFDLDDEGFEDAVWGAIELHRTPLVWPVLRLWCELRPDSTTAWTMTGWAHHVDGEPDRARCCLDRALALDPENDEAARIRASLPAG